MSEAPWSDCSPRVDSIPDVALDGTIACTEAERALLSCLLQMTAADVRTVASTLVLEDFTVPQLRFVLEATNALVVKGFPPDPVTVLGELRRTGAASSFTADRDAGVYLADLVSAAPSIGTVGYYREIVIEHAFRRRAQETAVRLAQAAGTASLAAMRELLGAELDDLMWHAARVGDVADAPPSIVKASA